VQKAASGFYEQHLSIFKLSFVEGFNDVSWVLFAVALVSFLFVLFVMEKGESGH
jgi:hypothetical protein